MSGSEHEMPEIITIVVLAVVVCIAWVMWTEQKSKKALDNDALEQSWRRLMTRIVWSDGTLQSASV